MPPAGSRGEIKEDRPKGGWRKDGIGPARARMRSNKVVMTPRGRRKNAKLSSTSTTLFAFSLSNANQDCPRSTEWEETAVDKNNAEVSSSDDEEVIAE